MRVLALNPFHGGSHRAFLDGWIRHSRHEFVTLTLPATRWKWRMRHAAWTFAEELQERQQQGERWDVLFATDMLNLAELLGLTARATCQLPSVLYFHENQLTYPVQQADPRDLHFACTNFVSALAADRLWFNTAWHRDSLLDALPALLRRMPDRRNPMAAATLHEKSEVQSPGIEPFSASRQQPAAGGQPLKIVWAARWEHDKQPEILFAACRQLVQRGIEFRLTVLGESSTTVPDCFPAARSEFAAQIDHWGYAPSVSEYRQLLQTGDVIVSTAAHEFFGIAVVEAVAAGCVPVVPRTLAYPEVLGGEWSLFHDGTPHGLARVLSTVAAGSRVSPPDVSRYHWRQRAAAMDSALEQLCGA